MGVMLTLLSSKTARQGTLFGDPTAREKSAKLMAVMDAINQEFGRDTLHSAAEGVAKRWAMRAKMRSPRYTTQWDELPVVSCIPGDSTNYVCSALSSLLPASRMQ